MKLAHITINTKALDESIEFYKNALGMNIEIDMRAAACMPIVFLKSNNDEINIELIENPDDSYTGSGISIGYHCDDIDTMHERLENDGFKPTPFISPNPNVRFFFISDPNGVKIQII